MPCAARLCLIIFTASCLVPAGVQTSVAGSKHERSFEECRDLAVSRGVPIRKTVEIYQREYMQRKAAGLNTTPKGFIVRCMAGEPV
jgi:hypothetical protein